MRNWIRSHIARFAPSAFIGCSLACILAIVSSCNPTPPPAQSQTKIQPQPGPQTRPVDAPREAAAPVFECRWTDEPITLDGVADEPAWKNAQVIDHFVVPGKKGKDGRPIEATRARLLWDREYLYYFAEMQDSDIYANVTEHNGLVYTNDAFELFFKPAVDKSGYYEFEVNPLGTTMELFIPKRNTGGYERYRHTTEIDHNVAVKLDGTINHWQDKDRGWAVEGRIRWRDLATTGGRPTIGETWKFAACRVNIGININGEELSSCAPLTIPSYHQYEDYATLKFVRDDIGKTVAAANEADAPAHPFGIAALTPWTTSNVVGFPDPPLPFAVTKAFPKLKIFQPLAAIEEPGADTCLVLQHLGSREGPSRLVRIKDDPDADTAETLLDRDDLIYGMTIHPDYIHNGYVYLLANGPDGSDNRQNQIVRYTIDRKPPYKLDEKSRLVILQWDSNGHNGGDLAFGPDGYLYHASGDGSTDSDRDSRGQDTNFLTSKMIRIDVDHPDADKPYSIPKDNPWIGAPGFRPEVWAYGFRNPWRIAFDSKTGDLWVGQNGQDLWEEVYLVHKGENYGWPRYEGSHEFQPLRKAGPTPVTFPIVEHPHSEMRSLTGGIVYRGDRFPELDGAFIYGDWSTGRIFGVKSADHQHATWHKELARTTLQISGFRQSNSGDIWIMDQGGAAIYKLIPNEQKTPAKPFPRKLSETGLFLSTAENKPEPALIPYDVNAPLWSDGALKQRFIAIPAGGHIDMTPSHGWEFPEGTVLVKTFSLEMQAGKPETARRLETRLMTKELGQWIGYTYLWNDQQTDADLADAAGVDKTYTIADAKAPTGQRTQTWHFPSRTECMTCHSRAMNFVLGPSTLQMNRDYVYPNGIKDNQLRVLEHLGLLRTDYLGTISDALRKEFKAQGKTGKQAGDMMRAKMDTADQRQIKAGTDMLLPLDPAHIDHLVDPYDEQADLNARARSYLHANCAICHVEAGGGNALMTLDYDIDLSDIKTIGVRPQHETFGITGARIVAPGNPGESILLHRVNMRGSGQMPPLATNRVDEKAVKLLREWIATLPIDVPEGNDVGK
ncbi:MAG TPA: PQQ-dependent sugar dehydrogenase [Tepidisphaeraceae bacterium]|nr:PQQ-dependent sugar dehydrogenase [Tepidisphaeraceae bacterium]